MATGIGNGGSATVQVPVGQAITTTGAGIATMGPGPQAGLQVGLQGANSLGPWDYAATVYLTGTSSLSYTVAAPIMTSPASAADLLPVATVQSLVSGGAAIDGAIVDAAQAPAAGVGVYIPSSGNFAGINMLWTGSAWRMQFAPGINVGLG